MNMLQKMEGIVIRSTDYGESHKIVAIFTREAGKISGVARGAKKPNSRLSAISQLFIYAHFLMQAGRGLGTLQQGEIISSFKGIKEDIFKTAYTAYIAEMVDKSMPDKEPNPYLFELLLQTFQYIDEGLDPDVLTFIFEMKMLSVLGLYPEMGKCAVCGTTEGKYSFSIKENGLVCHRCAALDPHCLPMSPQSIRLLRLFYYMDVKRLGSISVKPETKKELKTAIDLYYGAYSGLYLKSKRFLDQLDSLR
jgi:DNA repair protein RecO (recombination protein O)